jgi:hypothetical protein
VCLDLAIKRVWIHGRVIVGLFTTCRQREAELEKQRQSDLAVVETDYMQKMQDMVSEFGRAQQILKDKIIQLQNMYVSCC